MARAPTVAFPGPFENDAGRAVGSELVELLESELVRFRHRVTHDFGISLERARAALVALTKLCAAGVPWQASADAAPRKIFDSFIELITRSEGAMPPGLGESLHAELAEFLDATKAATIGEPPAKPTIVERLRLAGAAPELWWWSSQFDDAASCWRGAGTSDQIACVALAVGVPSEHVLRSLAGALGVAATRAKTKRTKERDQLVALLERLGKQGRAAIDGDGGSVSKLTQLAFELTASQVKDGIAELSVLAFQVVELLRAVDKVPDPERYAELVTRGQRVLHAHGVQLAGVLRRDLESAIATRL